MAVHISVTNSKLGSSIPSVNLPPCRTCSPNAPCAKTCYARKGNFRYSNVQKSMNDNYEEWLASPKDYEDTIRIAAKNSRFFRFHSAGDIPSPEYLEMMVRVARKCPGTQFLAFTKKWEIVNSYMNSKKKLPKNLTIVFSAWGDDHLPVNPHSLPTAYVRLKNQKCTIPQNATECSGFCGTCANTSSSCWKLKHGESVVFNQH